MNRGRPKNSCHAFNFLLILINRFLNTSHTLLDFIPLDVQLAKFFSLGRIITDLSPNQFSLLCNLVLHLLDLLLQLLVLFLPLTRHVNLLFLHNTH